MILILAVTSVVIVGAQQCPPSISPCSCNWSTDGYWALRLNCHNKNLTNTAIDLILNAMLNVTDNKAFQPLRNLTLSGNQLTQIPKQIKHFPFLREVNLAENQLTSVSLNDFNFADPNQLGRLVLSNNRINHIDGHFQIKFDWPTKILLAKNNITRLNSTVFQPFLAQLDYLTIKQWSFIKIDGNPIDCESDPCHLAWLIRDNKHLLRHLRHAMCSNGISIEQLSEKSFAHCPIKIGCPSSVKEYSPCTCLDSRDETILNCSKLKLGDAKIDQILTSFLPDIKNISSPLTTLDVSGNRLTRVPSQLNKFERLSYVDLSYNNIRNLSSGVFNFSAKSINLFINNNKIRSIEPDAFQGYYNSNSNILLGANNLTRFESKTFRSILETIINLNDNPTAHVFITDNLIDCTSDPCHLAWLIWENPKLLKAVGGGQCFNGTWFFDLDPKAYENCPLNDSRDPRKLKLECPARKLIYPCTCGRYDESDNVHLNCNNENLNDEETSRILDVFLNDRTYPPIGALGLAENQLTKIPHQIPFFSELNEINLSSNNITAIPTGAFNFKRTLGRLFLGSNPLNNVEPSAFLGNYGKGSVIHLDKTNLTRFDSTVFQFVLEQMRQYDPQENYVTIKNNSIDCSNDPCHLVWLTREDSFLLNFVYDAECSDGTKLKYLSKDHFANCSNSARAEINIFDAKEFIIGSAVTGVIIVVLLFTLAFTWCKYREKRNAFQGVQDLLKGNPKELDPSMPLDEQPEHLPYDKRWEFPRNRLRLGKELGVGAFGRVVRADAKTGLKGSETVTTVAVKMARDKTNVAALEALVSELKILIHLGSHENVVNLLGACTKSLSKGDLLVMVEYCRHGNLHSYLVNHRSKFINQLGCHFEETKLDFTNINKYPKMDSSGYLQPYTKDRKKSNNELHFDEPLIEREYDDTALLPEASFGADKPVVRIGRESVVYRSDDISRRIQEIKPNHQQQGWIWNYQADDEEANKNSISTRDLIYWSVQIARGMDYLVSRKVLHGDLAARNILLSDDNVVKVADFGLARQLYYDYNYQKKSQGKLPVRWMAIESLTDRNFSSQSDVWSFGVVLWELFSLGKVPYLGMPVDRLIHRLLDGYRMEKPEFASSEISQIMNDCWKAEPSERPTFNQLEAKLSNHLDDPVLSRRKTNADETMNKKYHQDNRSSIFLEMKAKFLKRAQIRE